MVSICEEVETLLKSKNDFFGPGAGMAGVAKPLLLLALLLALLLPLDIEVMALRVLVL